MANDRKAANRKIRQDALREWLSEKCTAQHLINNIEKIENLDVHSDVFKNDLDKLKVANDQRLKVMNKYIPDLKQIDQDNTHDLTSELKQFLAEIDGDSTGLPDGD